MHSKYQQQSDRHQNIVVNVSLVVVRLATRIVHLATRMVHLATYVTREFPVISCVVVCWQEQCPV